MTALVTTHVRPRRETSETKERRERGRFPLASPRFLGNTAVFNLLSACRSRASVPSLSPLVAVLGCRLHWTFPTSLQNCQAGNKWSNPSRALLESQTSPKGKFFVGGPAVKNCAAGPLSRSKERLPCEDGKGILFRLVGVREPQLRMPGLLFNSDKSATETWLGLAVVWGIQEARHGPRCTCWVLYLAGNLARTLMVSMLFWQLCFSNWRTPSSEQRKRDSCCFFRQGKTFRGY